MQNGAFHWLRMGLRQHSHMSKLNNCKRVNDGISKICHAQEVIKHATSLYSPEELMLCFNGGKDCTVLLDMLAKHYKETSRPKLRAICVNSCDPFEEVEKFIDKCSHRYSLELRRYNGVLKLAIDQVLVDFPQVRAVFLGCRRSDPGCSQLSDMSPCTKDWPPLMRIMPLLEWSYNDIWHYLRSQQLPYCSLYDQGYTSLGDRSNTRVNPNLLVYDEKLCKLVYKPAYELSNEKLERTNREDISTQIRQQNSSCTEKKKGAIPT